MPVWADAIASLRPASWEPAAPPEVDERWIEFSTGLATSPACSADAVRVAVPRGATLPAKPGCAAASESLVDKVKTWLQRTLN